MAGWKEEMTEGVVKKCLGETPFKVKLPLRVHLRNRTNLTKTKEKGATANHTQHKSVTSHSHKNPWSL